MNLDAMVEAVAEQAIWTGLASGVYGDAHWRRTFKLSEMIMKQVTGAHNAIVAYAALCHDIGRVNHANDRMHGYRGAAIALRIVGNTYANMALNDNQLHGTMVIMGKIQDIVSRHCVSAPDYDEFRIVHDANILDRVRFGGKSSIDVKKFALPDISIPLIDVAIELLEEEPVVEPPQVIQAKSKLIIPKGRPR